MGHLMLTPWQINNQIHNLIKCEGRYTVKPVGTDSVEWWEGEELMVTTDSVDFAGTCPDYCEQVGRNQAVGFLKLMEMEK